MTLLVALCAGASVFLFVATLTGHATSLRPTLPGVRRQRLSRQVWLRQAGVDVTPLQFWAVSALAAAAVLVVCWSIGGSAVVGLVPAATAGLGPRAHYARRRREHLGAVVEAWPQAIRDLLGTIGSHFSVHNALIELARAGPLPMRIAFADYEVLARLGGTEAALVTIREQLADPVSDRIIELLIVAHDQGTDLVMRLLKDQAKEVTADLQTAAAIHAAQQEPRIVAGAAFVMPWAGLVVLCAGVAGYRAYYGTGGGVAAVLIAGSISCGCLAFARHLSKEAAEPRVLGGAS